MFLSGEREIHDTADALRRDAAERQRHLEVLPLYARLNAVEQHRIFRPSGARRVGLSTNVAETSLTVPGVRYVVDAGTARISRYSTRLKVQRLPIEPVSQASADQRAGRCGRVAPGICIRLYGEDDFESREPFTEPEILRTNLASVILQMTAIGLGDVSSFPFLDPPEARSIRDGYALLEELGAIAELVPAACASCHADHVVEGKLPIVAAAAEQFGKACDRNRESRVLRRLFEPSEPHPLIDRGRYQPARVRPGQLVPDLDEAQFAGEPRGRRHGLRIARIAARARSADRHDLVDRGHRLARPDIAGIDLVIVEIVAV